MRFWSIAASVVLLWTQAVSAAEGPESGRVLRGVLVVQESPDDVPVVLQPGDDVPSLATFRVAEVGPCLIRWTGVSVALAAGSSGRFEPVHNNEPAAGVELTAGRGVLQTRTAAARWMLPGRTLRLELQSQSQLTVELPTRFRLPLITR